MKFIIIDDRPQRKNSAGYSISKEDIDWIEPFTLTGLNSVSFEELNNELSEYSLIAIHRSYLTEGKKISLNSVINYAKNNQAKFFILFSGGITQNIVSDNILYVNAGDFYSEHLAKFLKKFQSNEISHPLQQFLYGKAWRLPFLLELRQYLWLQKQEGERVTDLARILDITRGDLSIKEINKKIVEEKKIHHSHE